MIRTEGLIAQRGDFILGPVNLDLGQESYLTLLGPSGAGKTLFLETCMGLIPSSSGSVWLNGRDVTSLRPEHRHISYLPQDLALFPHLNVRENILFGAKRRSLGKNVTEDYLDNLQNLLNLHAIIDREDVTNLSGGEKQRVALARALLPQPQVLFLDEPFSALDATIKRQLQVKLREINRQLDVTILHVTHDQEEAFMLGEKIAVMIQGNLCQIGSKDDIYYRPQTLKVAHFLRNQNIFELTAEKKLHDGSIQMGNEIRVIVPGNMNVEIGKKYAAGIRSEEVVIIRPDKPLGPELQENLFQATVVDILAFGGTHTLCVRLNVSHITINVELPNCAMRDLGYAIGDDLQVCLRKRSLWTIPLN